MQQSFFENTTQSKQAEDGEATPLAARMRPRTLDDVIGQEHLLGPGKVLRRAIESNHLGSLILWGPPGTGKTSLAHVIARSTKRPVATLSAVSSGTADLRKIVEEARKHRPAGVVLIIDEVHRWNKAQQDALLPTIESGLVTLVGLTSENPYFDLIPALRSRLRVLRLEPLAPAQIQAILQRTLNDVDRGLGGLDIQLDDAALEAIVRASGGDARTALNALEASVLLATRDDQVAHVTVDVVREATQQRSVRHDRSGDDHYQTVSAFIKSMRGSDPDAAVFWLAKMLRAGEDPRFIARRMVILAAEDVGLADPQAIAVAEAVARSVEHVGMPEAQLILAEGVIYLATAPKSNAAAKALWNAQAAIEAGASLEVPLHLRNASFQGARALGYGTDYAYSHDFSEDDPRRYQQRYLPNGVDQEFFLPTQHGFEREIASRLQKIRAARSDRP